MKKALFFCMVLPLVFVTTSYSLESRHLLKENALSFKLGGHYYNNDVDLFDAWDVDEGDMTDLSVELAYEKNFTKHLSLEVGFGYFDSDTTYDTIIFDNDAFYGDPDDHFDSDLLESGDFFNIDILNLYIAPTLKCRFNPNDRFILYLGAGPNIHFTQSNLKVDILGEKYSEEDNFISFGAHGVIGIEMFIMKNPAAFDFYDVPLSLVLEYKYSWVNEIQNADKKIINKINNDMDDLAETFALDLPVFKKHDLDVGGHKFFIGLKWHY